jgi:hypothetical protein
MTSNERKQKGFGPEGSGARLGQIHRSYISLASFLQPKETTRHLKMKKPVKEFLHIGIYNGINL